MDTKNKLRLSFKMDPKTFDSRKNGDVVSSAVLFMLFNGLTEIDKNGLLVPCLAESYDISKDKKTYTFHIRKDAFWSDGNPITAYDFEYSWKKTIDPSFPSLCPQLFYSIKNAEKAAKGLCSLDEVAINALDNHTLVINLKNPTPYFLSLTSFCNFFPMPSHVKEDKFDSDNYINKNMIVSGPFKLISWHRGNKLLLEKNENYWNKNTIDLNQIEINIISDENTAFGLYENDEIDFVGALLSPLPFDIISNIKKRNDYFSVPIGATTFSSFNVEKFPFNNKNMRKAFGLAIDRNKIVDNITQGNEIPATRFIPPMLSLNRDLSFYKDNDTKQALIYFEKGLEELQVEKKDIQVTFSFASNILHKKIAEVLKEMWEKTFNITVNLDELEEKAMIAKILKHDFQASLFYWLIQYNDPTNIFDRFKYKSHVLNYPLYENEKYITLLDYSCSITNPIEREQILNKIEDIIIEDMPISPIYHHNYVFLKKPYIKDLFIGQVGEVRFDKIKIKK